VLHICGERDYDGLHGHATRPGYALVAQTDHFGDALAAADLAVSRAGGTVWELAAAGTPAVLVPYPHATADHQTLNARHFERGGGAVVVSDADVDRVPQLVAELLADGARLGQMREAMLSLARPHAADAVADELVAMARGAR
jgi:UDP-N-acetylglucosamine--N-acetylmuramyl-(pentapeptide) pyrophosphoryl-undecaprenol N-acetylglucosamine transferase